MKDLPQPIHKLRRQLIRSFALLYYYLDRMRPEESVHVLQIIKCNEELLRIVRESFKNAQILNPATQGVQQPDRLMEDQWSCYFGRVEESVFDENLSVEEFRRVLRDQLDECLWHLELLEHSRINGYDISETDQWIRLLASHTHWHLDQLHLEGEETCDNANKLSIN